MGGWDDGRGRVLLGWEKGVHMNNVSTRLRINMIPTLAATYILSITLPMSLSCINPRP